jgi:hypothetical protein
MFGGYSLQATSVIPILRALVAWGWLELTEGWRTWFGNKVAQSDGRLNESETEVRTAST